MLACWIGLLCSTSGKRVEYRNRTQALRVEQELSQYETDAIYPIAVIPTPKSVRCSCSQVRLVGHLVGVSALVIGWAGG